MNDDGTVAAIVPRAEDHPVPTDGVYVDVTDLYPYDFRDVSVGPNAHASSKGQLHALLKAANKVSHG